MSNKIIQLSRKEDVEFREIERDRLRIERIREQAERTYMRPWQEIEEGQLKVAEWCFRHFGFHGEALAENEHPPQYRKALLRDWLLYKHANSKDCKKLGSIYRRIAARVKSPFTLEELRRWGIEPPGLEWQTPQLEEIEYTPDLRQLYRQTAPLPRRSPA
jgi:hypothetical protein